MTPRQQLDSLIDLFAPKLRDAFLSAIADVVDNAILQRVIDAIKAGDAEEAFRALGFSDAAMRPLTAEIERAFETGGVAMGRTFPRYINTTDGRGVFRFNVRNSRAEAWLRDKSSSLITRLTDEARTNVRNTLVQGMTDGRNPRNVALDIVGRYDPNAGRRVGGVIGLTNQQEGWVRNARLRLETAHLTPENGQAYLNMKLRDARFDGTVLKAMRDGTPLPAEVVDRLMLRYKDSALQYRAETIARTEALQSLNAAEYEATKQAIDLGATRTSAVQREWDDVGDRRTRPTHRALNGQRVGIDEAFVSPSGARMMYPGDTSLGAPGDEVIMCRCRVRNVIDWAADID